jgi:hypothetical protein
MSISQNFPEEGPTLNLNFAGSRTLDPRITFTRTSSATYIDGNGLVRLSSSNTPRFNHSFDSSTNSFESLGLLIEESRTNLLNFSQSFSTSGGADNNWNYTNITVNGTNEISPDGTNNALRVTASSANATIISSSEVSSSASRTFSIFLRRVSGTGNIQYTLNNGSTWVTQAITSTWTRYIFPATTANQRVGIRIVTSGNSIELWGAQLETGSFATSYIPTFDAASTRAQDFASIAGSNFTGWYNSLEGTIYNEFYTYSTSDIRTISQIDDGTTTNRIYSTVSASNILGTDVVVSNSSVANLSSLGTYVPLTKAKILQTYKQNDFSSNANRGVISTDTSGDIPICNRLRLGWNGSTSILNGSILRFVYYPTKLSNSVLIAL